jgi:hypothetical protein
MRGRWIVTEDVMAKPLVDDELWAAVKQWGGGVASVIGPRSASTPGRRPFPRRTTKIGLSMRH